MTITSYTELQALLDTELDVELSFDATFDLQTRGAIVTWGESCERLFDTLDDAQAFRTLLIDACPWLAGTVSVRGF